MPGPSTAPTSEPSRSRVPLRLPRATLSIRRSSPATVSPFSTPAFQDFLIYQLHIGSFAGKNDGIPVTNNIATFVDVIAKLDYIRGLGFNAIELLPITDFLCDLPGASLGIGADEGYGPSDLFDSAHRHRAL